MTDTADNAPEAAPESTEAATPDNAQVVADAVAEKQEASTDFDFVLDKYKADGRSSQDAANEQAKAYGELQSKFGSFTGAPEEYEVKLSDEMAEHINIEDYTDDPLLNDFKDVAKEMGINGEGFNKMTEMYFKSQLAEVEAMDTVRAEEMKALGNNAERRLENIQDWAKQNLDSDTGEALAAAMTSAGAVQAIEAVIAKTRNAPQVQELVSAPAVSHEELKAMQVAKDEFGNPKMNDKAYRAKVNKLYDQRFGAEPHKVTVG